MKTGIFPSYDKLSWSVDQFILWYMIHIDEIIWKLFDRSPFFSHISYFQIENNKDNSKNWEKSFSSLFLVDTS